MYKQIEYSKSYTAGESGKFRKPSYKYNANERISIFIQSEWKWFLKYLLKEIQQSKEIKCVITQSFLCQWCWPATSS